LLYEPEIFDAITPFTRIDKVSFSADGEYLIAGGMLTENFSKERLISINDSIYLNGTIFEELDSVMFRAIRIWSDKGKGSYNDYPGGINRITDIKPMPNNSFIFCGAQPDFGRRKMDGTLVFMKKEEKNGYNFRHHEYLKVNNDGSIIGIYALGKTDVKFSMNEKILTWEEYTEGNSYTDRAPGIIVEDWFSVSAPKINSKKIKIIKDGTIYNPDITSDGKKIVFGTTKGLICCDKKGKKFWKNPIIYEPYCINISDNDKVLIAGHGDGIIRWFNMKDGKIMMSLFIHPDLKRWVLWSPEGYYDCSPGAESLIGWHVNQGQDKEALFLQGDEFNKKYYLPDLGAKILAGVELKLNK
jgi:hypothetical protein